MLKINLLYIRGSAFKWIEKMWQDREQGVVMLSYGSRWVKVKSGLSQSSTLGLLFVFNIHHLC